MRSRLRSSVSRQPIATCSSRSCSMRSARSGSMRLSDLGNAKASSVSDAPARENVVDAEEPTRVDAQATEAGELERRSVATANSVSHIEVIEADGRKPAHSLVALVDSARNV